MKLIVGLGNPGEEYMHNRHNVGFLFADYLLQHSQNLHSSPFKMDKKLHAAYVKTTIYNNEIIIVKPQTFMNSSGETVKKLVTTFDIPYSDLIVIHDDLDILLGKFKISP